MNSHTTTARSQSLPVESKSKCPVFLLSVLALVVVIAGALVMLAMSWAEPRAARAKARATELSAPLFDPPTSAAVVVLSVDGPNEGTAPGCVMVLPLHVVPCR